MENDRALEILTALREGKDPTDAAPLPADAPCQRPDVVRALYAACQALSAPAVARTARPRPPNAGKRWEAEDDARLARGHEDGAGIPPLATELGRTRASVKMRLVHLGLIEPSGAGILPRFAQSRPEPSAAAD